MATLGKMSEHIDLIQPMVTKDAAGFATTRDEVIASVRAIWRCAMLHRLGLTAPPTPKQTCYLGSEQYPA